MLIWWYQFHNNYKTRMVRIVSLWNVFFNKKSVRFRRLSRQSKFNFRLSLLSHLEWNMQYFHSSLFWSSPYCSFHLPTVVIFPWGTQSFDGQNFSLGSFDCYHIVFIKYNNTLQSSFIFFVLWMLLGTLVVSIDL